MVAPDKGTVHIQLTPRMDLTPLKPTTAGNWIGIPFECRVDADRRLHCVIRWLDVSSATIKNLPGLCDYLLIVAVAAAEGGQ
jgi:hypothetical protein